MEATDAVTMQLTPAEMHLLLEGLDAYQYWQLGDVLPRNNGMVFLPDDPDGDRYWSEDRPASAEQVEAIEAVRECRILEERLHAAVQQADAHNSSLVRFGRARAAYEAAVDDLVPLLIDVALASVEEALPGTTMIEVLGETNEDGLSILRIQRARNTAGEVLYDIETGHPDRAVEDRIDVVGSGYLDQLLDLTGGAYFGLHTLEGARGSV